MYINIKPELIDEYISCGWEIDKELKKSFKMKKKKSFDEIFENDVWLVFYRLGFKMMNKNRNFSIPYTDDDSLTQQIDVCAVDEDAIILIKCKSSNVVQKGKDFKIELEAIYDTSEGIRKKLIKEFPDHKIKFVFATKNYIIGKKDRERMKNFDIIHFDEDKLNYYKQLANHLGSSSKYQLLGNLFKGQKIKGIKNIVPAIASDMGGHKYYSFSIEPNVLLKLGYVLHRNDSNKEAMPTYQRIIKKDRIKKVREFVDAGGYFPNSIIVSINTGKKPLKFEMAKQDKNTTTAKMGLLYLPQMYQSIYIIDGQHRLYGYSDSKYKEKNTIPVVAFENLDKEEQIRIFMDINENQKAVPKNLRNTLEEDLNYYSVNNTLNRKALGLKVARTLGEDKSSPLYERIIIGENLKTEKCSITLETIGSAIQKSDYFSRFDKNNIITFAGTFDRGINDYTFELIYPFLKNSLAYLISNTVNEEKMIVSNPSIYGLIKVFNDIINYLISNKVINPLKSDVNKVVEYSTIYFKYIVEYWNQMSNDEYINLKSRYGDGGKTRFWRTFQLAIHKKDNDFNPEGMKKYWDDNSLKNYLNAQEIIAEIEGYLKNNIKSILEEEYGKNWIKKGVLKKVYIEINNLASQKNYEADDGEEVEPWDCLNLINYKEILWDQWRLFESDYTWPGKENENKKEKISWFNQLNDIRNKCAHNHVASSADIEFLNELKNWLIIKK